MKIVVRNVFLEFVLLAVFYLVLLQAFHSLHHRTAHRAISSNQPRAFRHGVSFPKELTARFRYQHFMFCQVTWRTSSQPYRTLRIRTLIHKRLLRCKRWSEFRNEFTTKLFLTSRLRGPVCQIILQIYKIPHELQSRKDVTNIVRNLNYKMQQLIKHMLYISYSLKQIFLSLKNSVRNLSNHITHLSQNACKTATLRETKPPKIFYFIGSKNT